MLGSAKSMVGTWRTLGGDVSIEFTDVGGVLFSMKTNPTALGTYDGFPAGEIKLLTGNSILRMKYRIAGNELILDFGQSVDLALYKI